MLLIFGFDIQFRTPRIEAAVAQVIEAGAMEFI